MQGLKDFEKMPLIISYPHNISVESLVMQSLKESVSLPFLWVVNIISFQKVKCHFGCKKNKELTFCE